MPVKLRRTLAVAGVALVVGPVLLRAQELPPVSEVEIAETVEGPTTEIRASAIAGTGHFSDCSGAHSIRYGGMGAAVDHRNPRNHFRARVAGAAMSVSEVVTDDDGTSSASAHWQGSLLGQLGGDWQYFGFLLGLGVFPLLGSNIDAIYLPAFNAMFRIGDLREIYVVVAAFDDPAVIRSLARLELRAFADPVTVFAGLHASLVVDEGPMAVIGAEGRVQDVTLGGSFGHSLGGAPSSWQGELTLGYTF